MNAIRQGLARLLHLVKRLMLYAGASLVALLVLAAVAAHQGWKVSLPWSPPAPPPPPTPAASPSPSPTSSSRTLRIGVDGRCASLPFWAVPDCLGPEAEGLKVEIVLVSDAELRWEMLSANRLDLACGPVDSFAVAAARGHKGTLLFRTGWSQGSDYLLARPGIRSLQQLTGKRVAVVHGHPGSYLMGFFLDRVGMSPSQVQLIHVDLPTEAARLLREGVVDAAWLASPWGLELRRAAGYTCLADTGSHPGPTEICAASPATMQASKTLVQAAMRSWFTEIHRIHANPGLAKDPIARRSNRDPSLVGDLLAQARFCTADDNHRQRLDSAQLATEMRQVLEFYKLTGGAPDLRALPDAERAMHLEWVYEVDPPAGVIFDHGNSPAPTQTPGR